MSSRYPTQSPSVYAKRRARLAQALKKQGGGVALVQSGHEVMRNRDADYAFRSDSYFYFLTGFPEPEACMALAVSPSGKSKSFLFCRPKHEEREIWDGFRFGPQAAQAQFGFDAAFSMDDFEEGLTEMLANQPSVFLRLGEDERLEAAVAEVLKTLRGKARMGVVAPHAVLDISHALDELRLIKDKTELSTMKKAATISAMAHQRAMLTSAPGKFEYEVEAELLYTFRKHGSEAPAYGSIVAGGANACVLHYRANDQRLKDGDLLLIDAGCELDCYASDITRTFPVNGQFSAAQQAVYEVVLEAQYAAIAATRPGARFNDPHDAAVKVLTQGLIDLKLLKMGLAEAIEQKAYTRFYMHRTSHWLGMDVHDCGSYRDPAAKPQDGVAPHTSRKLEPGMVLTIEPGLYIRPGRGVPKKFENIGIRIEDDAIVTAKGCDIYTHEAPKTVSDIHALMQSRNRVQQKRAA
ncbi:MAG TPA: aminopeptidase P N-terminal domain-containing protein [Limnobacter sp.]|uniref:aminopeptidase P N-terminal domain-containing protein n=1 Tax=Limnobacter sp. TaxID=2003368 RepID=UPI002EDA0E20